MRKKSSLKAVEVVAKARKLIEHGWTQGDFESAMPDGTVAFCSVGAIREVSYETYYYDTERLMAVSGAIAAGAGLDQAGLGVVNLAVLVKWNDDPTRTQEDVVLAFKRAEEILREQDR